MWWHSTLKDKCVRNAPVIISNVQHFEYFRLTDESLPEPPETQSHLQNLSTEKYLLNWFTIMQLGPCPCAGVLNAPAEVMHSWTASSGSASFVTISLVIRVMQTVTVTHIPALSFTPPGSEVAWESIPGETARPSARSRSPWAEINSALTLALLRWLASALPAPEGLQGAWGWIRAELKVQSVHLGLIYSFHVDKKKIFCT